MRIKLFVLLLIFCFAVRAQVIITVAGNHSTGYSGDGGQAINASFYWPMDVVYDSAGNMFVADDHNNCVRKVNKTTGIITTVAGNGTFGSSGDGGPATAAQIYQARSIVFDKAGNMYITTGGQIRKVNTSGIIDLYAGTGANGWSGDGGPATLANLGEPEGLVMDGADNLYFVDAIKQCVRKITPAGIISTFAGDTSTGYAGDGGQAINAKFNRPLDIALDKAGNFYVTDNNNYVVRKIDPSGIISTFAGDGTGNYSGDGGPATSAGLGNPWSIAVDTSGNVYISTSFNVIRKVNKFGIITTYAGNGTMGYSGDGGIAQLAALDAPCGLAVGPNQGLYFTDATNNVVREVSGCIPSIPSICMVEVDSLSQNNLIYWDKTVHPTADTFYIYRDTSNNNYALVGKVLASALSQFADTARTLYAANGDPNVTSWRYKIAFGDTCGGSRTISPMSPWHQTIYQYNLGGLFIWNHYQIEGQPTPVPGLNNYKLRRDNLANGNYITAATAAASSTNINDPAYATWQTTADWRVETVWNISCTPTMRYGNNSVEGAVVKARSNVKNNRTTGNQLTAGSGQFLVYPNPASTELTIVVPKNCENCQIEITNALGETVRTVSATNTESKISIADISNGVYFVKVKSTNNSYLKKLVVQH